jgi:hypothetical protein
MIPSDERVRYSTGEDVRVGDRVLTAEGRRKGVVEQVFEPGTPGSRDYNCPDGGVLIKEDWDGVPSLLLLSPGSIESEELRFVGRGIV